MKALKYTIITFLITISFITTHAQDYGTIKYWGKEIKIERSFFELLNTNYNSFMQSNAPAWRYYDYADYNNIYVKVVEILKRTDTVILVDEANQVSWISPLLVMPGQTDETGRNKKSKARAGWILHHVLYPTIHQFSKPRT